MTGFPYSIASDDDDKEETILERRERERPDPSGKADNDEYLPLIPDIKKDVRKTVVAIQVFKMDAPNDGLKGDVPPYTTPGSIAKLYGNGIFDFHAIAADGKTLRRMQGFKINIPVVKENDDPGKAIVSTDAHFRLLEWQAQQHAKETARVEAFGRMAVDTTREFTERQLAATREAATSQVERDRQYHQTLMTSTQTFFHNMFQASEQMHIRSMERQREDFTQTLQYMRLSQENNGPQHILGLLREGMMLAAGSGDEDEADEPAAEDPNSQWIGVVKEGFGTVRELVEASKLKAMSDPQGPMRRITRGIQKKPASKPTPQGESPAKPKRSLPDSLTPERLREIARLVEICDQRNLDFDSLVRNASQHLANGGNVGDEADASGGSSPDGAEETRPSDVGETDVDG